MPVISLVGGYPPRIFGVLRIGSQTHIRPDSEAGRGPEEMRYIIDVIREIFQAGSPPVSGFF
jgi:hypothetical protein